MTTYFITALLLLAATVRILGWLSKLTAEPLQTRMRYTIREVLCSRALQ